MENFGSILLCFLWQVTDLVFQYLKMLQRMGPQQRQHHTHTDKRSSVSVTLMSGNLIYLLFQNLRWDSEHRSQRVSLSGAGKDSNSSVLPFTGKDFARWRFLSGRSTRSSTWRTYVRTCSCSLQPTSWRGISCCLSSTLKWVVIWTSVWWSVFTPKWMNGSCS